MNNISNLLHNLMLFSIFLFCCCNQSFGQEKVNISAGMGFPECLNVGVRYQLKHAQIGIGFGFLPFFEEESAISVSGDVYYHFAGLSKLSNRPPWYGRTGLNYIRDETKTRVDKYLFLNLRIGREFNISEKIGAEIDAGPIFLLFWETTRKPPGGRTSGGWTLNLGFPGFGIGLFYRI